MADTVFKLAKATGWPEEYILNLPTERFNTYVKSLNDHLEDESRMLKAFFRSLR